MAAATHAYRKAYDALRDEHHEAPNDSSLAGSLAITSLREARNLSLKHAAFESRSCRRYKSRFTVKYKLASNTQVRTTIIYSRPISMWIYSDPYLWTKFNNSNTVRHEHKNSVKRTCRSTNIASDRSYTEPSRTLPGTP
jgi:hypothetical protein